MLMSKITINMMTQQQVDLRDLVRWESTAEIPKNQELTLLGHKNARGDQKDRFSLRDKYQESFI